MLVLSIDTSTFVCSLFITRHRKVLAGISSNQGGSQLSWLMPSIEKLMKEAGIRYKDLEALAVGLGPGGYTGLRIGIATIKTLAQILKIPVYGFNSLDILSFNALDAKDLICPVNDAKKNQLYAAIYKSDGKLTNKISPYLILSAEEFCRKVNEFGRDVVLLGTGIQKYLSILKENLSVGNKFLPESLWYPQSCWMPHNIDCGRGIPLKYFEVMPFYLREPDVHV